MAVGTGVAAELAPALFTAAAAASRAAATPGPANAPSAAGTTGRGVGIDGCNACRAPPPRDCEAAAAVDDALPVDSPLNDAPPPADAGAAPALLPTGVAVGRAAVVTVTAQRHVEFTSREKVPARP